MADVNGIAKVQLFNQLVNVSSVCVHFVAGNGLRGASMSAAVMSDHAVSPLEKEHHLSVPVICRERPAMVEKQRLAGAPVLVINLRAIFRRDCGHWMTSLTCWNCVGRIVQESNVILQGIFRLWELTAYRWTCSRVLGN